MRLDHCLPLGEEGSLLEPSLVSAGVWLADADNTRDRGGGVVKIAYMYQISLHTHNSSLEGSIELKFAPFCSP